MTVCDDVPTLPRPREEVARDTAQARQRVAASDARRRALGMRDTADAGGVSMQVEKGRHKFLFYF